MKICKTSHLSAACAALALVASLSAEPLRAQDADGFVPLFNGKNLDGWQGATDVYAVEEGKLVCQKYLDKNTGRPRPKGHLGFLGHGSRVEFRNIRIKEL